VVAAVTAAVAGLVLAAGAGRRFGSPKAVVEIDGERLVDRAVRTLREGGAAPAYVVGGAVALDVPGAVVVANPDWAEGIGSSLRAGLAALTDDCLAVAVVLVDQPGLTGAAVERVLSRADGPATVVVATYAGALGHPVVLGRDHWAEAGRLAVGDTGARPFLAAHAALVTLVECSDVATDADVDRPGDLDRFRSVTP